MEVTTSIVEIPVLAKSWHAVVDLYSQRLTQSPTYPDPDTASFEIPEGDGTTRTLRVTKAPEKLAAAGDKALYFEAENNQEVDELYQLLLQIPTAKPNESPRDIEVVSLDKGLETMRVASVNLESTTASARTELGVIHNPPI
jgi:hypothetical protein